MKNIQEIKNEMDQFSRAMVEELQISKEVFIAYSVYIFTYFLEQKLNREKAQNNDLINELQNGLCALEVLLLWSDYLKSSDSEENLPEYIEPSLFRKLFKLYDKAEDYSIITEAFMTTTAKTFTHITVNGNNVSASPKTEDTDYLRELASRSLMNEKSYRRFSKYESKWNDIARNNIKYHMEEICGIANIMNEKLDDMSRKYFSDFFHNQIYPNEILFKELYEFYKEKNTDQCVFDVNTDLNGFTVSDYFCVLGAIQALATNNYSKCYALYNSEEMQPFLHFDLGRYLGCPNPNNTIHQLGYWSIIADKREFSERLSSLTGLKIETVNKALDFLTYGACAENQRLYEKLIIPVGKRIIIPPFIIPLLNVAGMLQSQISVYDKDLYSKLMKALSEKEIRQIEDEFKGFDNLSVKNSVVLKENGDHVTDIDIMVYDKIHHKLLIIEHKANRTPHFDKMYYIDKVFRKAEIQLSKAKDYINAHCDAFFSEHRIAMDTEVSYCILSIDNLGSSMSNVTIPIITTDKMIELIRKSNGMLSHIIREIKDESYMKKVDTSPYYVEQNTYKYAGYTFTYNALKFH